MAKKIIWSLTAQNDCKEILSYWIDRNKSLAYSQKLNLLFNDAAKIIANFQKPGSHPGIKNPA